MITTYEDYVDRMLELYPDVERKSMESILKRGLQGLLRVMKAGEELLINGYTNDEGNTDEWLKFFIPLPPEVQKEKSIRNYYKKQYQREFHAERKSNSKQVHKRSKH